ncbi:MAG: chorismate synthase [Oscillospiraceae bacterium]|nr:chorismate synthase [Oscillospiraceae bacterium]
MPLIENSSEYGENLKIKVFGKSHGDNIGVEIDGFPKDEKIDLQRLNKFLERRKPGKNKMSTPRAEGDIPNFESGLSESGVTNGEKIRAIIWNTNTRSNDYDNLKTVPRPAHADFTAHEKFNGQLDMRGGGHFSGRLTAPLCIAGGMALQVLDKKGINIGAHVESVGGIHDVRFPLIPKKELFETIAAKEVPVIDDDAGERMREKIEQVRAEGDSIGGTIECVITGVPVGLGEPMFGGIENRLAAAIFGIPAVKGIEFGNGFECSTLKGSQNNDPFIVRDGKVMTETNNHGGALGGITSGMPIVFRVAFKPTPSISLPQKSVELETMKETTLEIKGRHDPCIVIRAVPVVEAVAATVILDMLGGNQNG